jgi:8-hydroxy-5-deazaflavin:NADPH oxidoreductase
MKIAIIGAGRVGGTLGTGWSKGGHEVVFGVRDPEDARVIGLLARAGTNARAARVEQASENTDVVVLTVPWAAAKEAIVRLGDLRGRILFDCTNPASEWPNIDHGKGLSGGQQVAVWAGGARVVKIFNTTGYENMADAKYGSQPLTMFYAGDDTEAKKIAHQLAADLGFEPQDAGLLTNAPALEVLASFCGALAYGQKLGRNVGFRLARR